MWNESEREREMRDNEENVGRSNSGSEVVIMDDRAMATAADAMPNVANLSVTKSSRVHIGPKFVSVMQNVHNGEVVKGRILGLELVSSKSSRRLRCSVAVFVCWALVVTCGLTVYLLHYAMAREQTRLDLESSLPRYIWKIVKSTTKAERLSCAAALLVLITCLVLIVYFTVIAKKTEAEVMDISPHEWNITREMWLAQHFVSSDTKEFQPLRLVIIQHTVSSECHRFIVCAAELRSMQGWFITSHEYDIPYNFLVGNDGRVYEGRGWGIEGAHTRFYNKCSIGIGFIGDYREEIATYSRVTEQQINRTKMLLEEGVRLGYLHPDYHVVGARDISDTQSPGSNLYNAIRKWAHYDHNHLYREKSCDEIQDMFNTTPQ